MKKVFLMLICLIILNGCGTKLDYKKIMEEKDYVIIDVRTKEEYDELHVVDAINISYDEINENIEIDKNKVIFVYCKSGNRSSKAYNTLKSLGYTVYDLGAISDIDLEKNK